MTTKPINLDILKNVDKLVESFINKEVWNFKSEILCEYVQDEESERRKRARIEDQINHLIQSGTFRSLNEMRAEISLPRTSTRLGSRLDWFSFDETIICEEESEALVEVIQFKWLEELKAFFGIEVTKTKDGLPILL